MNHKYYTKFKIFTVQPFWTFYLKSAYKKSLEDLRVLGQFRRIHNNEEYTALLCGTSGSRTSETFIKYVLSKTSKATIYILDGNDYPLEETKEKIKGKYPSLNIKYIKANALAMPFKDCTIDYIETDSFFQFFTDTELLHLLKEWFRILKEDGYISTRCFASQSLIGSYFDNIRVLLGKYLNVDFKIHKHKNIVAALKESNFSYCCASFILPTLKRFTLIKSSNNTINKYALVFNSDNYFLPKVLERTIKLNPKKISCIFEVPLKSDKSYLFANARIFSILFTVKLVVISFAKKILNSLVQPIYLQKNLSLTATSKFYNIRYYKVKSVNEKKFADYLISNDINIVLSFCSDIYKSSILKIPNIQFYNFHPSLLPNNKGRFPIFWALYKNEKQGVTCHEITSTIDSGKILFQFEIPVKENENMEIILTRYINMFPELICKAINRIELNQPFFPDSYYPSYYGPVPSASEVYKYKNILSERKKASK